MYMEDKEMTMDRIAIIGAGPGGLMLARLLQREGKRVVVFERDRHQGERPQGGSLDLHEETGQHAIRSAGLQPEFAAVARPEDQGDRLYDTEGTLLYDRDGLGDDRPEVDRGALRQILLNSLEPGTVRWGHRIGAIRPKDTSFEVCGDGWSEPFDLIVGADGAWSCVRPLLSEAEPSYEGVTLVELGFDIDRHPAVDALTGRGKMFAVGDNRALITQRNGQRHIRGYAGLRVPEGIARQWRALPAEQLRAILLEAFIGWAPSLMEVVESGDILAIRPLHALPIGHRWRSAPGLTLLGDAAHLMSPFSGEGVNLALADATDLAQALVSGQGWAAVSASEEAMAARAEIAAEGAAQGVEGVFSSLGAASVLEHYLERTKT
ncbi:NAD(P)/FAD-dependent oxidoreductase [Bosea sp. ASV33]|uniref:FAD-dependent oxidoreductase n=1 Tax=Bosea sp. ASV33 TaxID=2795106 RepID=UPI0020C09DB0|nr:NAD(P)/FAD-dependent oxidoreductase [Bosea sp. ASV33]